MVWGEVVERKVGAVNEEPGRPARVVWSRAGKACSLEIALELTSQGGPEPGVSGSTGRRGTAEEVHGNNNYSC